MLLLAQIKFDLSLAEACFSLALTETSSIIIILSLELDEKKNDAGSNTSKRNDSLPDHCGFRKHRIMSGND